MPSIGKLYQGFTEWLEERRRHLKDSFLLIKRSGRMSWYCPKPEKPAREFDKKRFDTEEIEEAYLKTLNGEGLAGDMASMRFQAGALQSCQRAYLLQHTTPARLLVHGYIKNSMEAQGLYAEWMLAKASDLIDSAKAAEEKKR